MKTDMHWKSFGKKKENQLTKQAARFHSLQDALMMW